MKKSQVTAQEVAKRAGVSPTTVSFVMNDIKSANISEATRQRVIEAADELAYVPRAAARSLAQGRSDNLGLVLIKPHDAVFNDPYMPHVIKGISLVTRRHGFRILVEMVEDSSHSQVFQTLVRSGEVACAIVAGSVWDLRDDLKTLVIEGFPVVSLDMIENLPTKIVSIDHFGGVRKVVSHLINLNHQRIACIVYSQTDLHARQRLDVFRETLRAANLSFDERLLRFGDHDPESGYAAMKSLLEADARPTAVFGMNDMMAIGAMTAIREAGLSVPDDIAVAGYDGVREARFTYPPLTTASSPEVELGQRAAAVVLDMLDGKPIDDAPILLQSQLIVRESCGANPKKDN